VSPAAEDAPTAENAPTADDVFATDEVGVDPVRMTAWVRGRVQGVGMRWWIRSRALELGLQGWASNLSDGRVEVVAEGTRDACRALADLLASNPGSDPGSDAGSAPRPTRPGRIEGVVLRLGPPREIGPGFRER